MDHLVCKRKGSCSIPLWCFRTEATRSAWYVMINWSHRIRVEFELLPITVPYFLVAPTAQLYTVARYTVTRSAWYVMVSAWVSGLSFNGLTGSGSNLATVHIWTTANQIPYFMVAPSAQLYTAQIVLWHVFSVSVGKGQGIEFLEILNAQGIEFFFWCILDSSSWFIVQKQSSSLSSCAQF